MAGKTCPLWRGKCREHNCLWYSQIHGKHPSTGADTSEWGCAMAWLPWLIIENTKEARHTTASVDKFNNNMVNSNAILGVLQQIENRGEQPPQLTAEPK